MFSMDIDFWYRHAVYYPIIASSMSLGSYEKIDCNISLWIVKLKIKRCIFMWLSTVKSSITYYY